MKFENLNWYAFPDYLGFKKPGFTFVNSSPLLEISSDINSSPLLEISPDIYSFMENLYLLVFLVLVDIHIDMILCIAGIALTVGILYISIGRFDNPLAELSEMEKKRREQDKRYPKLSDKISHQILVNKRRVLNNQEPLCYSDFVLDYYGHISKMEGSILVEIMWQIPSSHLRYTFPYNHHNWGLLIDDTCIVSKQTNKRACADWDMYVAVVRWEEGVR